MNYWWISAAVIQDGVTSNDTWCLAQIQKYQIRIEILWGLAQIKKKNTNQIRIEIQGIQIHKYKALSQKTNPQWNEIRWRWFGVTIIIIVTVIIIIRNLCYLFHVLSSSFMIVIFCYLFHVFCYQANDLGQPCIAAWCTPGKDDVRIIIIRQIHTRSINTAQIYGMCEFFWHCQSMLVMITRKKHYPVWKLLNFWFNWWDCWSIAVLTMMMMMMIRLMIDDDDDDGD